MKTVDIKKNRINEFAITRNLKDFDKDTGNVYETVAIMSKRANQISMEMKDEFHEQSMNFSIPNDSLEEIFENKEQIELARDYEQFPKPVLLAIYEFEKGETHYKRAE
ncbi:MAG: DNA-directed RNA polymerase subunit omega [Bacteroidales bacterium]|jgi:DNA-directed RNA polymerase subunit K/omega|nr:DNA-directed RNA polymerase subunit omega [Bacteroidales bacterium]